jgi:hypothetical protein
MGFDINKVRYMYIQCNTASQKLFAFSELLSNVAAINQRVNCFSTSALCMSGVRISATPQEALVDEKVHIKVDGLPRNGPVTIKASLQEGKLRFSSFGCYTATDKGQVFVENQASVQGTYTGN